MSDQSILAHAGPMDKTVGIIAFLQVCSLITVQVFQMWNIDRNILEYLHRTRFQSPYRYRLIPAQVFHTLYSTSIKNQLKNYISRDGRVKKYQTRIVGIVMDKMHPYMILCTF